MLDSVIKLYYIIYMKGTVSPGQNLKIKGETR